MSIQALETWLDAEAPASISLTLRREDARAAILARHPLFTLEVPTGKFPKVVAGFHPYVEAAIDYLVRTEEFTVGDDLQQLLDQGLYNPNLTGLFEELWYVRFEHTDGRRIKPLHAGLMRRTFEAQTPLLQSDALLFWLTLLAQNQTVAAELVVLLIEGAVDPDLSTFTTMAEQWLPLGSPLRVLRLS